MTTATANAPSQFPMQDKWDLLEQTLNQEIVERRSEIRAVVTALVAGVHVFLLGQPGVAKSMLLDRVLDYLEGAKGFKILMSRFTTPDEVFGPVSLQGLKNDQFVRKIEGYLATAHLGLLDEGFKANSAILNSLLWAINERQYRHDTEVITIPLSTVFIASNEMPQDDSLNALFDRLLYRFEVKTVRDQQSFLRMLRTQRPENPKPILTWDEVEACKAEAKLVVIPDPVHEALAQLRRDLATAGIEPTPRRFVEFTKIIRATAWLDGRDTADVEDLGPGQHVFWEVPEQAAEVTKVVQAIANPLDGEAQKLLEAIEQLEDEINKVGSAEEKHRKGQEIHQKLRRCAKELKEIRKRAGNSRRRSEVIEEATDRLGSLTERTLSEIFSFDPKSEQVKTGL